MGKGQAAAERTPFSARHLRGQAAVEYLTTYGWAILVLIIVLAILVSSGMLSPNYLVSEECNFGTNIPCQFALYNEGDQTRIGLKLFNGFPYRIKIRSLDLQLQDGTAFFDGFGSDLELESGASYQFNGTLSPALAENTIKRFSGNLTYVSCAPEINATGCSLFEHTITGRVVGRVLPQ